MNYDEFVAEYGNRPKDIVYNMAVRLERERIIKDLHSIEFEANSATDFLNKTMNYIRQAFQ